MTRWVCPQCDREFGAVRQAHTCLPGITVAELLSRHPDWVGAIYAELIAHLRTQGPIHEDAVNVGVFLLSDRKLAEFRPRVRSAQLALYLPDRVEDPRIARTVAVSADRFAVLVKLTDSAQVDSQVCEWLTEAYAYNTDD